MTEPCLFMLFKGCRDIKTVGIAAQNPDRPMRSFPDRLFISFKVVPFHLFTGQLKHKERSRGEPYVELINITELGTEKAQKRHNGGTEKAQDYGTSN